MHQIRKVASSILQILPCKKHFATMANVDTPIVPLDEGRRFISECMQAVGTPPDSAAILAANLIEADYRGHYSHGMNRLDMYINDVKGGICDCTAQPSIIKETPATAWVHGNNGLGAVVGLFSMELAMKKAKSVGVGMVVAKESNHYGIAGIYALQAIKEGLLGMSFTNTSPLMTPTRAKESVLGTNPLSFGAPGRSTDGFVLDMATTAVALGKMEIQKRKDEPIPEGWALDESGSTTADAAIGLAARRLMPLGGSELNSGYKGYGLAMMVEVLCGVLADAAYGPNVRQWGSFDTLANLGHCFIAIDPACFAPGFTERMGDLMDILRNMEPVEAGKPVLVAGDPERSHMEAVDKAGGVKYVQDQHDTCRHLAEMLNVRPLQTGV